MTYGPSGTEFTALQCNVSIPHSQIACLTAPGTGRVLHWIVTVGGQQSGLSIATTSYAGPTILSVTPGNGPTVGGGIVTLSGVNFGTAYAASKLLVRMNYGNVPRPANWAGWVAAMLAGALSPFPEVDKWINDMTPATQVSASRFGSVESVSFFAPPGFGPSAEVIVLVDGIPSPYASYTYDAPTISNLAPDRKSLAVVFAARCAAKCF